MNPSPLPLLPPGADEAAVVAPGDDVDEAADPVHDLLEAGTGVSGEVPGSGTSRYVFLLSYFFSSLHLACFTTCFSSSLHLPDDDDDDLPDSLGGVTNFIVSDICESFNFCFKCIISFPEVPGSEEDDDLGGPFMTGCAAESSGRSLPPPGLPGLAL